MCEIARTGLTEERDTVYDIHHIRLDDVWATTSDLVISEASESVELNRVRMVSWECSLKANHCGE
jgi:hypothetical protein